jgi:hypothetical protein
MDDGNKAWLVAELERLYALERQAERLQGGEAEELERALAVVRRWLLEGGAAGVASGWLERMERERRA